MEREKTTMKEGLAGVLHRRVDHLELSAERCERILAAARPKVFPSERYWPSIALAAAACLLIAVLGVVELRRPPPARADSQVKRVSIVYEDEARTVWLVVVRKANGTESYINVVTHKPRREESKA